jgi:hypothetical protein
MSGPHSAERDYSPIEYVIDALKEAKRTLHPKDFEQHAASIQATYEAYRDDPGSEGVHCNTVCTEIYRLLQQ